ncbi:hypothetical protein BDZ91DRAFT_762634 [Kalaharituber pfeilii]|nr:hypothetical protein BDZ91DRAFT_762634 [Kalaharituber pfeilii]
MFRLGRLSPWAKHTLHLFSVTKLNGTRLQLLLLAFNALNHLPTFKLTDEQHQLDGLLAHVTRRPSQTVGGPDHGLGRTAARPTSPPAVALTTPKLDHFSKVQRKASILPLRQPGILLNEVASEKNIYKFLKGSSFLPRTLLPPHLELPGTNYYYIPASVTPARSTHNTCYQFDLV